MGLMGIVVGGVVAPMTNSYWKLFDVVVAAAAVAPSSSAVPYND